MDIVKQNEALKKKILSAMCLLDWVSERISKADYQADSNEIEVGQTEAWKELDDAMHNGFLASYHEEFLYRDMDDEKVFGKAFCEQVWNNYYDETNPQKRGRDYE